jgi:hypothetical protein
MKTQEEIQKKIKELLEDENNFASLDYGCDGMSDECCGCCGGMMYSEYQTQETLEKFAKWLME